MDEQQEQQLRAGVSFKATDQHGDEWRAFSVMFPSGIRDYTVMCRQDEADIHALYTLDAAEAAAYMSRIAPEWKPYTV